MATPVFPETIPGVSSVDLDPTSQVVSPDEGPGALTYRRFTRVPHARATVKFRFLETDFEAFQQFYEVDLKRGHKWFSLKLPSAAGIMPHAVRCIRHRVAPSNGYNYREVTMELEIRGRRIYEDDLEGPEAGEGGGPAPQYLWLDLFNGTGGTLLNDHQQDIRLENSFWTENNGPAELNGSGSAQIIPPPGETIRYAGGGRTDFGDYSTGVWLKTGYRFEIEFTITPPSSTSDEGGGNFSAGIQLEGDTGLAIFHSNESDRLGFQAYTPLTEDMYFIDVPRGPFSVVFQNIPDTYNYELKLNGIVVYTFDELTPQNYNTRQFSFFMGYDSDCTIERAALFGEIGEPPPPPQYIYPAWYVPPTEVGTHDQLDVSSYWDGPTEPGMVLYGAVHFKNEGPETIENFVLSWNPNTPGHPAPNVVFDLETGEFSVEVPYVEGVLSQGTLYIDIELAGGAYGDGYAEINFYDFFIPAVMCHGQLYG